MTPVTPWRNNRDPREAETIPAFGEEEQLPRSPCCAKVVKDGRNSSLTTFAQQGIKIITEPAG